MKTIRYEGVEIETCPGCGGEWLDGGELRSVVNTVEEAFPQEMVASLDAINENIFAIDESCENQLSCPKCPDTELNRFNYASSSGIALDKCPECDGIWLDRDEIEHVQILVEQWRGKLEEDVQTYGPMLEKMQAEAEARDQESPQISRLGFVNSVLRMLLRWFA